MMTRTLIRDLHDHVGDIVLIKGWISVRRDQGKLVFFDMRDMSGVVQGVVLPASPAMEIAKEVRLEFVVSIEGVVNKRPEKNINAGKQNGDIELSINSIEILNSATTPPFDITSDTTQISEEARLKHRYVDLRSERMQKNLRVRSDFVRRVRNFLFARDFTEIETPLLTESTPEGSRDFVVPSRLHPGQFYALPQSPQQYKQLLMVGGFERYFQIARAVRDEDLRADRGFEHSQVDMEMSFVNQEDIMQLVETMMIETVEGMGYAVKETPFPRYTHKAAVAEFGSDKFDLRTDEEKSRGVLAYAWVHQFPFFERLIKDSPSMNSGHSTRDGGSPRASSNEERVEWTFTHNPFSLPIQEHIDMLLKAENIDQILTTQYDLVCNGYETGGGSIRSHRAEVLQAVYKIMGFNETETEERIGHMLGALQSGAPPHGGIALGIERILMNLTGESYLREVQAFPMTRGGQTAVMKAPKPLMPDQLRELGLRVEKEKQ